MNNFLWLEQWYADQCHGGWEHTCGVRIDTLDRPGWRVRIDLQDTPYATPHDREIKRLQQSETEWMQCRIVSGSFDAAGGPLMLGPIVQVFRNWIEAS